MAAHPRLFCILGPPGVCPGSPRAIFRDFGMIFDNLGGFVTRFLDHLEMIVFDVIVTVKFAS